MLIYAFMGIYILVSVQKLVFNLDDNNTTQKGLIDLDENEIILYNETNLFNFFVIRKQVPVDKPLYLGDELS